ncbi:10636_t:CDS:2 [Cetraspora pellucida]|uniref:10636_t:CDS:1 n=1 Tax=Cetraspora pellucida TaxID=1433469 RepID=A0A9N9ATG0_9GLOM|nr:10636_t:CDS:2 [Cetraspora pellucida]
MQVTIELTYRYYTEYVDVHVMNKINLSQHIWKKDKDQIQSAIKLIEMYTDIEIMLSIIDSEVTMISFGIIEIINQLEMNMVEIDINKHKDLVLLTQGLEPIEEDEVDKTYELVDKNKHYIDTSTKQDKELNNEADEELVEALQEYEKGENRIINNIILEEFNQS